MYKKVVYRLTSNHLKQAMPTPTNRNLIIHNMPNPFGPKANPRDRNSETSNHSYRRSGLRALSCLRALSGHIGPYQTHPICSPIQPNLPQPPDSVLRQLDKLPQIAQVHAANHLAHRPGPGFVHKLVVSGDAGWGWGSLKVWV